ncbi:MAG: hypothetical protein COW03_10335 [Cytophagales bacterium CG12_big_fil_rev_8_21_14_0_65_40_12]|nr:MAG: hypothetical protein COW03_10335 [Cytophagales bacterium CG12_big_fil_rev_8_21_14_0_65_40_12]
MTMKKFKIYFLAFLASAIMFTSCDEDDVLIDQRKADNPLPDTSVTGDPGTANLSKYVSIGNSLTAGFMDGALYTNGQANSFPNMLAAQFQVSGVGGGAFNQPDINSANGYSGMGPNNTILGRLVLDLSIPGPVPTQGELPTAYTGNKAALNNFGVPGMRLVDIADASFAGRNPLFARFASAPGTKSVLEEVLTAQPTFYTFWLGNNDVLGYAAGGGVDDALITSNGNFQNALVTSLGAMTQAGAKGIVLSLPPIVLTPYFRAVRWNALPLNAAQVSQLNPAFAGLNQVLDGLAANQLISAAEAAKRKVVYQVGTNPILMFDKDLEDLGPKFDILVAVQAITPAQRAAIEPYRQSRPATSSDLPTFLAASEIGRVIGGNASLLSGISVPIGDRFVLSANEVVKTVTARATYNGIIKGVVDQINSQAAGAITIVDVQPTFADLFGLTPALAQQLALGLGLDAGAAAASQARADGTLGISIEGKTLAPDFGPNGVFSVDGIHPNPRGSAIIANLIIEKMNATYGSTIPTVGVLAKRGILVN